MASDTRVARRRQALGRYGEDVACRYLSGLGWDILDRNWRCSAGEVDIVARDGELLVVCEVKTRASLAYGTPAEAVTFRKQARLRRLAAAWIAVHESEWRPARVRIDVVAVTRPQRGAAIVDHIPDI